MQGGRCQEWHVGETINSLRGHHVFADGFSTLDTPKSKCLKKTLFGEDKALLAVRIFRSAQATHAGEKYWKCRIMYDCVTWASLHDMLLKGWWFRDTGDGSSNFRHPPQMTQVIPWYELFCSLVYFAAFLKLCIQCIPYISIQRLVNIGYPKIHCLIIMFIHVNISFLYSNHIMGCFSFSDRPKMAQISLFLLMLVMYSIAFYNISRVYSEYIPSLSTMFANQYIKHHQPMAAMAAIPRRCVLFGALVAQRLDTVRQHRGAAELWWGCFRVFLFQKLRKILV